ncbi:MAG: hypothetical protein ACSHXB_04935 [Sulfitobacter sp.]
MTSQSQSTEPWVANAIYDAGNFVQNISVRFKSVTGTGSNASITIGSRSETYYAPPGTVWGKWQEIDVGFMGPIGFKVDVSVVGDAMLVGEVRYLK